MVGQEQQERRGGGGNPHKKIYYWRKDGRILSARPKGCADVIKQREGNAAAARPRSLLYLFEALPPCRAAATVDLILCSSLTI